MVRENRKPSPAEARDIENFVQQLRQASDTPSLLQLLAGDGDLLLQCRKLVRAFSANHVPLLAAFNEICHRQGFNPERIRGQLELAARALGISARSVSQRDYYQCIGVEPSVSAADIQHAYRRKAKVLHPDTRPQEAPDSRDFIQLQEAYRTLKDPELRRYYDQSRGQSESWCEPPACEYRQPPSKKRRPQKTRYFFQLAMVILGLVVLSFVFNVIYELKSVSDSGYEGSYTNHTRQNEIKPSAVEKSLPSTATPGSKPSRPGETQPATHTRAPFKTARQLAPLPDFPDFPAQPVTLPRREKQIHKHRPLPAPLTSTIQQKANAPAPKSPPASPARKPVDRQASVAAPLAETQKQNVPLTTDTLAPTAPEKSAGNGHTAKSDQPPAVAGAHNPGMDTEPAHLLATMAQSEASAQKPAHPERAVADETGHLLETLAQSEVPAQKPPHPERAAVADQNPAAGSISAQHAGAADNPPLNEKRPADDITPIKSFIDAFSRSYESRDFNRFSKYFAPDAREDGKPFSETALTYRRNFELIQKLSFKVELNRFSQLIDQGIVRTRGTYEMKWLPYGGKWQESHGEIAFELVRSGDSYKVRRLDYP